MVDSMRGSLEFSGSIEPEDLTQARASGHISKEKRPFGLRSEGQTLPVQGEKGLLVGGTACVKGQKGEELREDTQTRNQGG